jgi:hypothetical protein
MTGWRTSVSGSDDQGQHFTFADEYAWLNSNARARIFDLLNDSTLYLDAFCHNLNEPDIVSLLLAIAKLFT